MLRRGMSKVFRLIETLDDIVQVKDQDVLQENANVDGRSPMGMMGKISSESARYYAMERLLSPEVKKAIEENIIYPHDLDFYASGTTTCCQIPLGKLLRGGFNTGHGHMREPQDIKSAMALLPLFCRLTRTSSMADNPIRCLIMIWLLM